MAVNRLGAFTAAVSAAAATVALTLPTGIPNNHNAYALIFCQSGNGADPTPPSGWTLVGSSGVGTSGSDVNASKLYVFGKAVSSADSGASVTVPWINGHVIATSNVYLGVDPTTPFTVSSGKAVTPAVGGHSTNSVASAAGDGMASFIAVYGDDRDSNTASSTSSSVFTGITPGNTSTTTMVMSASTALGGGGGVVIVEGNPTADSTAAVSHSVSLTSSIYNSLMIRLNEAALGAGQSRAQFNFRNNDLTAVITGSGISAATMGLGTGSLGIFGSSNTLTTNYPNVPFLNIAPLGSTTTPAAAITNNSYFEVTITGSGNLKRIQFKAAKGGATSNRGFAIRSSNDAFASDVAQVLDVPTVRAVSTFYDYAVDIPLGGTLTLRFYIHGPGSASTLETDDFIFTVETSGVSGVASITEVGDTMASTSKIAIAAVLALTDGNDMASGAAGLLIQGAAAITEGNDTVAAAGLLPIVGTASIAENQDTVVSTGVLTAGISGTASIAEAADTVASASTVRVAGVAAITEGNDAASGAAGLLIAGVAAITEGNDTVASASTLQVKATAAIAEAADTVVAVGSSGGISATASITEQADAASGAASLLIAGSAAITEQSDTVTSTSILQVKGEVILIEAPDAATGAGQLHTRGQVGVTEANDVLVAAGLTGDIVPPPADRILGIGGSTADDREAEGDTASTLEDRELPVGDPSLFEDRAKGSGGEGHVLSDRTL